MGNFKVLFKEISAENNAKQIKNIPNPLLKDLMTFNDDLIARAMDIDDWELD